MIVSLALLMALAHADPAGQAWLDRIDAAAHVEDAHLMLDVTTHDRRDQTAQRTIEIWQKGDDRRLVRITAPARLKGVGLLVTHGDTIHLFLPAYPPARRVIGSKRADAFMGTDFAVQDLSRITYGDRYDAVITGHTDDSDASVPLTTLTLSPTADDARLVIQVGEDAVVRRVDTLDQGDTPTRRLVLGDVRPEGGVLLAHTMTVEDLQRGRRTEAIVRSARINSGLSDDLFTVTNLERP